MIYTQTFSVKELPTEYIIRKMYSLGYDTTYQKGNGSYLCGCPICHEGNSRGKKQRCYYLPNQNLIYCFNCGRGYSPYSWIKEAGNLSYQDIKKEVLGGEFNIVNLDKEDDNIIDEDIVEDVLGVPYDSVNLLEFLDGSSDSVINKAVKYLKDRGLDTAVNRPDKIYLSHKDYTHGDRIIFPFFDGWGRIPFYQSRAFGGTDNEIMEQVRYLSKVGAEKSVFNLDKVSGEIDDIYVFEGPIDACFVKNGVAVAGVSAGDKKDLTDLQRSQLAAFSLTHRLVWILDNQNVDKTSEEKTQKLLEQGECVFIWDKDNKYKDFNEWCIAEKLNEIPIDIIRANVKCGLIDSMKQKADSMFEILSAQREPDLLGDLSY
jgi:hypothetical protein